MVVRSDAEVDVSPAAVVLATLFQPKPKYKKPHLHLSSDKYWTCAGQAAWGHGATPVAAYRSWQFQRMLVIHATRSA